MISVQGLTKYYGEHAAILDISFSIARGEVIGFLGLNGAGKSTTLKVLGCVLLPTSGKVEIDGFDVVRTPHEIRKRIGFLPDTPPLYDEMTVGDYLAFVAQLRGVPKSEVSTRVHEAETLTDTVEVHSKVISSLSHGFRQRVGVAQALVHSPDLLILDEPTGGLDPMQIVEMRNLIKNLKGKHTVLLSSHILSEVSQVCDRLLVIQEGRLVAQGTLAELSRKVGAGVVVAEVRGDTEKAVAAVKGVAGVQSVVVSMSDAGHALLNVVAATDVRAQVVRALVGAQVDVLRIEKNSEELESIFLQLTQRKEAA